MNEIRRGWANGPLYHMLCGVFPTFRTPKGVLDVQALKTAVGRSHEAIYKWLRTGSITSENAWIIIQYVTENPPAVAGYKPPVIEDFCSFFPGVRTQR